MLPTLLLSGLTFTNTNSQQFSTRPIGMFLTSLWDIVNIAKIHIIFMGCLWLVYSDKKEGIFLSVDPFKEKKINIGPFI